MKRAVRTVYTLFYLSIAGSIWAIAAYMLFPIESGGSSTSATTTSSSASASRSRCSPSASARSTGPRRSCPTRSSSTPATPTRGRDTTRAAAVEIFADANEESGFGRRALIRNSPHRRARRVLAPGHRAVPRTRAPQEPSGTRSSCSATPCGRRARASRTTRGHPDQRRRCHPRLRRPRDPRGPRRARPQRGLPRGEGEGDRAAHAPPARGSHRGPRARKDWSYDGIVAYSKVCTHVGCPVALYEQQTHHLLCPCHQSQFDVTNGAAVIFGPAARPLPQLPITVDDEGYLVAQSDFTEPVGPSFWERH